jgi:acyl-CoA synthetase (NDP forming)
MRDSSLEAIFRPCSIALAGITVANPEHWTRNFLSGLVAFGFDGPIYLVNPRGGEIDGRKVYHRLSDIPQNVDYVISTVPASASPGLMEDCAAKGVKAVHFCTSGFSETGTLEGIRLETRLKELASSTGIRIIGPNCLGIYCPSSRLSFRPDFPGESGTVGLIMQSGGNTVNLIKRTEFRGVRFSKVISYGNAYDLDESDFLEYLTDDHDTCVIGLYIEGVRDGRKFHAAAERAAKQKPLVLLKGGITREGTRTAAGHTGSLAGSREAWEALCRQMNIITVDSVEEMADLLVTLALMPHPGGRRMALLGFGGGSSVLISDHFGKRGLLIPPLPEEIKAQILEYTPIAGNILTNPVDYSQALMNAEYLARTLRILFRWQEVDHVIGFVSLLFNRPLLVQRLRSLNDGMLETARELQEQMAIVAETSIAPEEAELILPFIQKCAGYGFPVYFSFASAAGALDKVLAYNERQSALKH